MAIINLIIIECLIANKSDRTYQCTRAFDSGVKLTTVSSGVESVAALALLPKANCALGVHCITNGKSLAATLQVCHKVEASSTYPTSAFQCRIKA